MQPKVFGSATELQTSWWDQISAWVVDTLPEWLAGSIVSVLQWIEGHTPLLAILLAIILLWLIIRVFVRRIDKKFAQQKKTAMQYLGARGAALPIIHSLGEQQGLAAQIEDIPMLYKKIRGNIGLTKEEQETIDQIIQEVLHNEKVQQTEAGARLQAEVEVITELAAEHIQMYNKGRRLWNISLGGGIGRWLFGTSAYKKLI